jgi:hypothetical protein
LKCRCDRAAAHQKASFRRRLFARNELAEGTITAPSLPSEYSIGGVNDIAISLNAAHEFLRTIEGKKVFVKRWDAMKFPIP